MAYDDDYDPNEETFDPDQQQPAVATAEAQQPAPAEQLPMPEEQPPPQVDMPEGAGTGEAPGLPTDNQQLVHPMQAQRRGLQPGQRVDPVQAALHNQLQRLETLRQQVINNPLMYHYDARGNRFPSAHMQGFLAQLYHDAGHLVQTAQLLQGQPSQMQEPQYNPQQNQELQKISAKELALNMAHVSGQMDDDTYQKGRQIIQQMRQAVGPPKTVQQNNSPLNGLYEHPKYPGVFITKNAKGEVQIHDLRGKGAGQAQGPKISDVLAYREKFGVGDQEAMQAVMALHQGLHPQQPAPNGQVPEAAALQQQRQQGRMFDQMINSGMSPQQAAQAFAQQQQAPIPMTKGSVLTAQQWLANKRQITNDIDRRIQQQQKDHAADPNYTPALTPDMRDQAISEEMAQAGLGRAGYDEYATMRRHGLDPRTVSGHRPAQPPGSPPGVPFPGAPAPAPQAAPPAPQQAPAQPGFFWRMASETGKDFRFVGNMLAGQSPQAAAQAASGVVPPAPAAQPPRPLPAPAAVPTPALDKVISDNFNSNAGTPEAKRAAAALTARAIIRRYGRQVSSYPADVRAHYVEALKVLKEVDKDINLPPELQ